MKTYIFSFVFLLFSLTSFKMADASQTSEDDVFCRVCCELSALDVTSGIVITVSKCAGGPFTSCEDAGVKACQKAAEALSAVLEVAP